MDIVFILLIAVWGLLLVAHDGPHLHLNAHIHHSLTHALVPSCIRVVFHCLLHHVHVGHTHVASLGGLVEHPDVRPAVHVAGIALAYNSRIFDTTCLRIYISFVAGPRVSSLGSAWLKCVKTSHHSGGSKYVVAQS